MTFSTRSEESFPVISPSLYLLLPEQEAEQPLAVQESLAVHAGDKT
jgi:hypothetical protein